MNKISITIQSKIGGSVVFDSTEEQYKKAIPAGIPVMDVIDDSLDSFVFTVKDILRRKPFQPFDLVTFTITDDTHTEKVQYFVLNDNAKTYRNIDRDVHGYPQSTYEHTIACVEATKYLEKIKVFELTMTNRHDTLLDQFKKAMNNIEPPIGVGYGGTVSMTSPSRFSMTEELATLLEGVESCDFSFQNTDARTIFDEILARVNARVVVHNVDFDAYGRYAITLGYHLLDVATEVVPIWELGGHGQIVHEEMGSDGQDYAGTIVARGYNSIPDEPLTVRVMPASSNAQLTDESATLFLPYPISSKGIKSVKMEATTLYYKGVPYTNTGGELVVNPNGTAMAFVDPSFVRSLYDLTPYFITQEEYELLPENDRWGKEEDENTLYKASCLPYQIGAKEISLCGAYSGRFRWTHFKLADIIQKAGDAFEETLHEEMCGCEPHTFACNFVGPDLVSFAEAEGKEGATWYDVAFQIEYYPLLDTVASLQKTNETNLSLMAVMDSQTEQTLDISRHGKKLAGLLKRVGNDSYVVDVKAKTYSGLLKLLSRIDVDGDKYVLYKRDYAVYNDFVNCRYFFSQNYTAVQENAGVNRERQIFPIPTEYNETPILIKKKLEFNLDSYRVSGTCKAFSADLVKSAMQTILGEKSAHGKLNYLLFQSIHPEYTGVSPSCGNWYLLPLASYVLDNTMNFIASPLDNYSVAYSRTDYTWSFWGTGGRKTIYNPYVDSETTKQLGEVARFRLQYGFDFPDYPSTLGLTHNKQFYVTKELTSGDGTTITILEYPGENDKSETTGVVHHNLKQPIPSTYPIVALGALYTAMSKDDYGERYFAVDYKKDRMQKPSFVLSLSVAVAEKDKGKLFVNPIFAKMNNLVRDNGDVATLYVWTKNSVFREGEEFVSLASINRRQVKAVFDVIADGFYAKLEPTIDPNSGKTYLEKAFGLYQSSYQSWGICDSKGMVYLAVNDAICDIALVCRD